MYSNLVDLGSYRIWMEACPPYCENDETGNVNESGIDSVSGPKPSH